MGFFFFKKGDEELHEAVKNEIMSNTDKSVNLH